MNRMLFRVDGSEEIGMGHIFRCVILANAIRELDSYSQLFFCTKSNTFARNFLNGNGFQVIELDNSIKESDEIKEIKRIIIKNDYNQIIIDKFDIDDFYVTELKKLPVKVTEFFYDTSKNVTGDICINPNVGYSIEDYKVRPGSRVLIGNEYILVHDKFFDINISQPKEVNNILITFGASDKNNITPRVLNLINEYYIQNRDMTKPILTVVIGPSYSKINEIMIIIKALDLQVRVIFNTSDLSEVMKGSELAITSIGGTIYELLSARVPSIGILQSENQEGVATYLHENGCIYNLGNLETVTDLFFFNTLENMLNYEYRLKMVYAANSLIDGKGAKRCAKEILS